MGSTITTNAGFGPVYSGTNQLPNIGCLPHHNMHGGGFEGMRKWDWVPCWSHSGFVNSMLINVKFGTYMYMLGTMVRTLARVRCYYGGGLGGGECIVL